LFLWVVRAPDWRAMSAKTVFSFFF